MDSTKNSHTPRVCKLSTLMSPRPKGQTPEERLLEYGAKAEQKKAALRKSNAQKEIEDCSFKPEIAKKSRHLASPSTDTTKSHSTLLYEYAAKYRDKRKRLSLDLTKS